MPPRAFRDRPVRPLRHLSAHDPARLRTEPQTARASKHEVRETDGRDVPYAVPLSIGLSFARYQRRADFNACTTFRSISARASTLCNGVTFHSRSPHAGMSRTMRSASSFDAASITHTKGAVADRYAA